MYKRELKESTKNKNPLGIMFVSLSECCDAKKKNITKIYMYIESINVDDFSIRFYDFSFI